MQEIPDLFSRAAVTDVAERTPEVVGQNPERGDALVHFAKLPRPGDDAAAVDDSHFTTIGGPGIPQ